MLKRPIAQVEKSSTSSLDFDLETVMHQLYHLTICKSRIPKVLREYTLVERRHEKEEQHLCEIVGQHLRRGSQLKPSRECWTRVPYSTRLARVFTVTGWT